MTGVARDLVNRVMLMAQKFSEPSEIHLVALAGTPKFWQRWGFVEVPRSAATPLVDVGGVKSTECTCELAPTANPKMISRPEASAAVMGAAVILAAAVNDCDDAASYGADAVHMVLSRAKLLDQFKFLP
jgi:hypothetical protein